MRFRCECARLGCDRLIELSVHEYEEIRANPQRFVLLPGHEFPDSDDVIAPRPGYIIVEKRDEAGEVAEAHNRRG